MSVDVTEQSILGALHQVPAPKPVTLPELLAMPSAERDAILEAQAASAEFHYRHDPELTGFDAFDEEDLDVDYTDSPPR
jgi:hypothetical protein